MKQATRPLTVLLSVACVTGILLSIQAGKPESPGTPGLIIRPARIPDPRIPIRGADIPLVITKPGYYYLAESIEASIPIPERGITIRVSDVTIDLYGFSFTAATLLEETVGIVAEPGTSNIVVENGTVRDWGIGVDLSNANGVIVTDIRAINTFRSGIEVGSHALLSGCLVQQVGHNGRPFARGIFGSDNCVLTSCRVFEINGSSAGIDLGNHAVATDCFSANNGIYDLGGLEVRVGNNSVVRQCAASGYGEYGIVVGSTSVIERCVANEHSAWGYQLGKGSKLASSTTENDAHFAISAADGCMLAGNRARASNPGAFRVGSGSLVSENWCSFAAHDSCMEATGSGSMIQNNHLTNSRVGLSVPGTGNFIVGNSAFGNHANYTIAAGNKVGAVASDPAAAGPWDNLEH